MRPRLLVTGIVAAAMLTSCGGSSIVGPDEMVAFARAKALWESRSFADYTYEIRTFCFCPPEMSQWTVVAVKDGAVISAHPADPNPTYPLNTTTYFQPIDSLFSRLHDAMSDGGFNSAYAEIEVDYNKDLGYPQRIVYHAAPYVADAGATIEIKYVSSFAIPDQALRRRR